MALGEIGLSYDGFYRLTPRSFTNTVNGFRNRRYEESKTSWEQIRYLFYAALKPHLKGNPSLKKLMPLPWDNEGDETDVEKVIIETPEQAEEILKQEKDFWAEVDKKRNKLKNGISAD